MNKLNPPTLLAAAVAVFATLLALLIAPNPPKLSGSTTGDAALADQVREAIDDPGGYRGLSVALVEGDRVRFAGLGDSGNPASAAIEADTAFEIGSVTKPLTGMLLADLIADGRLRADEPLRELLPGLAFDDPGVGAVTPEELTSHRAGLPSVPPGRGISAFLAPIRGKDPYAGMDTAFIRRAAGQASIGDGRGEVHYSNFGVSLLGLALAERARTPYPRLLSERILAPIGMTSTVFRLDGAPPIAGAAVGGAAAGREVAPWTASGIAPAGSGVWSTASDLSGLMRAMLAGGAPGADAATPRFDADTDEKVGYGWFTTTIDGRAITWHNGGTGGFRSYVGFEPASGRAVVVLGNTDRKVDPLGARLLGLDVPEESPSKGWPFVLLTLALLAAGAAVLSVAIRPLGGHGPWSKTPDRLNLVDAAFTSLACLWIVHRAGEWLIIPPWLWAMTVGLASAGTFLAVWRWRTLPTIETGGPAVRWVTTILSGVICLALTAGTIAIS